MGPIGLPELIVILIVALLFFGPKKLPELGRSLGRAIRGFKDASSDLKESLEREIDPPTPPAAPKPSDDSRGESGASSSP